MVGCHQVVLVMVLVLFCFGWKSWSWTADRTKPVQIKTGPDQNRTRWRPARSRPDRTQSDRTKIFRVITILVHTCITNPCTSQRRRCAVIAHQTTWDTDERTYNPGSTCKQRWLFSSMIELFPEMICICGLVSSSRADLSPHKSRHEQRKALSANRIHINSSVPWPYY